MGSRRRAWAIVVVVLSALLVPDPAFSVVQLDDQPDLAEEFDSRRGTIAPTPTQRALVELLGADVTWNRFGTPGSLTRHGKFLTRGIEANTAVAAAGEWLEANRALFRLSSTDQLVFVTDTRMAGSRGHAVSFRQVVDGLMVQDGGLVTVGLTGSRARGWEVGHVSSSLTAAQEFASRVVALTGSQAWVKAARSIGADLGVADIRSQKRAGGWLHLAVAGESTLQRVRLVAFPTVRGVVPAYEAIVVDKAAARAFQVFLDAGDGSTLARYSLVHNLAAEAAAPVTHTFGGEVTAGDGACGPDHTFSVGSGIRALDGFADATLLTNDLVLFLLKDGVVLVEADTLFTPESFHFEPEGGVEPGDYVVRVCDFVGDGVGWAAPRTYEGTFTIDDTLAPAPYLARWHVFPANPPLNALPADPWNNPSTDTRERWCWVEGDVDDCDRVVGNLASRGPWDFNHKANAATFTTTGNNAVTAESWLGPFGLLPGPNQFRPTSAGRDYSFPWTNDWNVRDCNTDNFVVGSGYDVSAAATNLFVAHNRMHDWAYFLGFTERNFNAQDYNFGLTERRQENDPLVGDVQAGAMIAGVRDNANMITLPDGMSPITNMYLWQPFAGSFYAPCVDGDFDMAVIGHEYTHLIENRMIGKGSNRTGFHAGAMGESFSDLTAMEYLNEYDFVPTSDENRYAVGAYATGNKLRAIRNYGMNFPSFGATPEPKQQLNVNALNFSDMGYDITGPQVHADGEIWSATNFAIRQALVEKYDSAFPAHDAELQAACADGELRATQCPGNRRWIQLVFDAYLLMPTNPSMLQARDALLAADVMRFGGANQREIWLEFARHGFGVNAASSNQASSSDFDPMPDFEPMGTTPATVRFITQLRDGTPVPARIYVGHYEARVSPIADTDPATPAEGTPSSVQNLDDTATFAPGTYEFVANAPGFGHVRFRQTLRSGNDKTVTIRFSRNWASSALGATASGDGGSSVANLIDDTEGTNWTAGGTIDGAGNLSVAGKQVTVDLAGTETQRIRFVQVSALLLTPPAQNRFTALRQFEIWACNANTGVDCSTDAGYTAVYTSPPDAFPGDPPRPVAPHMILRLFDIPDTLATHLRLVVLASQCTGGPDFQGDQDADPLNNSDCDSNVATNASRRFVRAAELQAFTDTPLVTPSE